MRLPQPRHQIIRPVANVKDLYLCTDQRATSLPKFEGSSGGGGYFYYLHKEQHQVKSTIQKECDKLLRKCAQRNKRSSAGASPS